MTTSRSLSSARAAQASARSRMPRGAVCTPERRRTAAGLPFAAGCSGDKPHATVTSDTPPRACIHACMQIACKRLLSFSLTSVGAMTASAAAACGGATKGLREPPPSIASLQALRHASESPLSSERVRTVQYWDSPLSQCAPCAYTHTHTHTHETRGKGHSSRESQFNSNSRNVLMFQYRNGATRCRMRAYRVPKSRLPKAEVQCGSPGTDRTRRALRSFATYKDFGFTHEMGPSSRRLLLHRL